MSGHVVATLEAKLCEAKTRHHTLVTRVNIVNQLISSTIWYMTQLWTGKMKKLEEVDRQVKDFMWSEMEDIL